MALGGAGSGLCCGRVTAVILVSGSGATGEKGTEGASPSISFRAGVRNPGTALSLQDKFLAGWGTACVSCETWLWFSISVS